MMARAVHGVVLEDRLDPARFATADGGLAGRAARWSKVGLTASKKIGANASARTLVC